jgi:predicted O-methyltransferase YrrM
MNNDENIETDFYQFTSKEIFGQSLIHLINLYLPKDSIVVELGTGYGQTACMIAQQCKDIKTIYTIDPYLPYKTSFNPNDNFGKKEVENAKLVAKHNIEFSGSKDKIKLIVEDCKTAISNFKNNSIDLLFYDASRNDDATNEDLLMWYKKIKTGGIISGHCWNELRNGIIRFKNEINNKNRLSIYDNVWVFKK